VLLARKVGSRVSVALAGLAARLARGGAGPTGRRVVKVRAVRLHGVLKEAVSAVASERRDGLRIGPVAASAHRVPQPATALSVGRDALKIAPVAASAHRDASRIAQAAASADLAPRPASAPNAHRDVSKTAPAAATAHRDASKTAPAAATERLAAQARNAPPVVSETAPSARPAASTATPTAAPRANSVETVRRAATAASAGHLLDHAPEQPVLRKPVRAASVRRAASATHPIARVSAASADRVATAPRVASKANAESVENEALRSP
jgi:hypothetical protein